MRLQDDLLGAMAWTTLVEAGSLNGLSGFKSSWLDEPRLADEAAANPGKQMAGSSGCRL